MALRAPGGAGGFVRLLRVIMTAFAIFVEGVLSCQSLSLGFGFVAFPAQLSAGLAFLPGVVAFQAVNLQGLGVLLMRKSHFPVGDIKGESVFLSGSSGDHQNGEQKADKDGQAQ